MGVRTKLLEKDPKKLTRLVKKLKNKNKTLARRAIKAEQQVKVITSRARTLEDELKLLRYKLFGKKSEKYSVEDEKQGRLFNEAEDIQAEVEKERLQKNIKVTSYVRRKRGRKPLPANLAREEIIHDIPEEEKVCSCCESKLVRIGEEVSEKLEIIPAQIKVIRNIRPKYACNKCDGCEGEKAVKIASVKPEIMPKSIVTPGLLAYILVSKYADAIPFYRQEKQFKRIGVDISRADLSNWAIKAGKILDPFVDIFLEEIRSGPVVQMDETRVQVLNEHGRSNTSKSYMWVMRGGPPLKPVILYRYHPTRGGEIPIKYLGKYSGILQTDAYEGYNEIGKSPGIIHAGCWAHVRRKYYEASKPTKKPGSAEIALGKIARIYSIEKELRSRELSPDEFVERRKIKVEPILKDFKEWIDKKVMQVPPTTLLGKAVNYTLKQWEKLIRYLESPYLTPDTNRVENDIRPFVVGRRNWLFSGSPLGAFASATIYSIVETAKANGLEPYSYLKYLFTELPVTKVEDYKKLMPQYLDPKKIEK
ncbi:MAG TPA: IS66 family transposase [Candidatus Atribacteria bacterium]|nr:IS66 family transposase [Candidatus Atribacteria bacterium]